jgi:hypothetical protein
MTERVNSIRVLRRLHGGNLGSWQRTSLRGFCVALELEKHGGSEEDLVESALSARLVCDNC